MVKMTLCLVCEIKEERRITENSRQMFYEKVDKMFDILCVSKKSSKT